MSQSTSAISQLSIDLPINGNGLLTPSSCTLNYYDGEAYEGLPFGELGEHGAVVKTETLIIRGQQINDAYDITPQCFETIPNWNSYPTEFKNNLQNSDDRLGFEFNDDDVHSDG